MSEDVVYLTDVRRHRADWSKKELGYLERAAHLVRKLGISVETDHGVSDEGEPWFVICDADSDEVLAHFCRIRGRYIACAPFLESSLTGHVFADLVECFLDRHTAVAAQSTRGLQRSAALKRRASDRRVVADIGYRVIRTGRPHQHGHP
jgi:hypothetical protein